MKRFFNLISRKGEDALKEIPQPMAIAVDFDGTCVEDKYPDIGSPLHGSVETLQVLAARGYKIILWTCRENHGDDPEKQYLDDAVNWFQEHSIPLAGINETPADEEFRPSGGRKVFANLYIDDRAFGGFPGWARIHEELIGMPLASF